MNSKVKLSGQSYNIILTSHLEKFSRGNDTSSSTSWTPTYSFPNGNSIGVHTALDLELGSSVQWSVTYPHRVVWPLNIDATPDSLSAYSWDNKSYGGIDSPLFAMGYLDINLTADFSQLMVQKATECALTPCVRTMETSVRNGETIANTIVTNFGGIIIGESQPDGRVLSGWNATVNRTNYFAYDSGIGDSQGRAFLLIQALRIALEGNTTYSHSGTDIYDFDSTSFTQSSGPWSSAGQQAIDGNANFSNIIDRVGQALSGRFQQLQDSVAIGTTLHCEAIIIVRSEWIAYLLALTVFGLVGLLLTILSTHHQHMAVWKESTLPLLFRYTESAVGTGESHAHSQHKISNNAQLPRTTTALTFNTVPPPDPNRVSSIINQAAAEQVQLRKRDSFWVLDRASPSRAPTADGKNNITTSGSRLMNSCAEYLSQPEGFQMQALQLDFDPPPRDVAASQRRTRWV